MTPSMWEQTYLDTQKVLDVALGTEEADGAGAGIAADVHLLAVQRDEARANAATLRTAIQRVLDGAESGGFGYIPSLTGLREAMDATAGGDGA